MREELINRISDLERREAIQDVIEEAVVTVRAKDEDCEEILKVIGGGAEDEIDALSFPEEMRERLVTTGARLLAEERKVGAHVVLELLRGTGGFSPAHATLLANLAQVSENLSLRLYLFEAAGLPEVKENAGAHRVLTRASMRLEPIHKVEKSLRRVGLPPEDWGAALDSAQQGRANIDPDLSEWVWATFGHSESMSFETFVSRVRWGVRAAELAANLCNYYGGQEKGRHPAGARFKNLAMQMREHVEPFSEAVMLDCLATKRSFMTVSSHAGCLHVIRRYIRDGNVPMTVIGAGTSYTGAKKGNIKRLVVSETATKGFLQLIRASRKEAQGVAYAGDGLNGVNFVRFPFANRKMLLATGGASLSHALNAAVLFIGSRWQAGHRLQLYQNSGPVMEKGMPRAEWDAMYYRFFVEQLVELLEGDPENMMLVPAGWRIFDDEPPKASVQKVVVEEIDLGFQAAA